MTCLIISVLLASGHGVRVVPQLIVKSGGGFATKEGNNMSAYRNRGGLRRFSSGQFSPEHQNWRLLVIGDSMVLGLGGTGDRHELCSFRCSLWEKLTEMGYAIEMLGSQENGPSNLPDTAKRHEGHAGWSMDSYGFQTNYKDGIRQYHPDIILSNIGHNEVYSTICQQGGWGGAVSPNEAAEAAFTRLSQNVVSPLCENFPEATILQSVILADNRNQSAGPAMGPHHSCYNVTNENRSGGYIHDTIKELNNLMRSSLPSCSGRAHLADFYPEIHFCIEAVGCYVHPNQNQYDELGRAYANLTEAIILDLATQTADSSSLTQAYNYLASAAGGANPMPAPNDKGALASASGNANTITVPYDSSYSASALGDADRLTSPAENGHALTAAFNAGTTTVPGDTGIWCLAKLWGRSEAIVLDQQVWFRQHRSALIATIIAVLSMCLIAVHIGDRMRNPGENRRRDHALYQHIDGLRLPLTVWVYAFHYVDRDRLGGVSLAGMQCGRLAVVFFFIVAGMLSKKTWKATASYRANILHRLSRLWLVYYCSALAVNPHGLLASWEGLWYSLQLQAWCPRPNMEDHGFFLDVVTFWIPEAILDRAPGPYIVNGPAWFITSLTFPTLVAPWFLSAIQSCSDMKLACATAGLTSMVPFLTALELIYDGSLQTAYYHFMYTWPPCCASLVLTGWCLDECVKRSADWHGEQVKHFGWLADGALTILIVAALTGEATKDCSSWAEDGCTSRRVVVNVFGPICLTLWLYGSSFGGLTRAILSWSIFGDVLLFCQPTLAMFLFQDFYAYLLAAAGFIESGQRMGMAWKDFTVFCVYGWLASFLWSFVESKIMAFIKPPTRGAS